MRSLLAFVAFAALSTGLAAANPIPPGLKLALTNFYNAKTYHMSISGQGMAINVDVVNPNRTHTITAGIETISIGPVSYTRMNGTWQKLAQPGPDFGDVRKHLPGMMDDNPNVTVTDRGMTTVGGRTYHRYTYVTTDSPDLATTIDVGSDNEIYRLGYQGGLQVTLSKFNAPITITAPI